MIKYVTIEDFEEISAGFKEPVSSDMVGFLQQIIDAYKQKRAVPATLKIDGKYQYQHRYSVALAKMYAAFDGVIPVSPY